MGRYGVLILLAIAFVWRPATAADWSSLQRYQQTITREEFNRALSTLYAPSGALTNYLSLAGHAVNVFSTPEKSELLFTLRFGTNSAPAAPRPGKIKRIALDPGHIGGEWARMEERFFVRGADRPVQEAVLNLTVARLLKARLEALGATVLLTKDDFQPVTEKRPEDFRAEAESFVAHWSRFNRFPPIEREAAMADTVRKRQELLFLRSAEIAARARKINEELRSDPTICIHFNAVEWNDRYDLVEDNRLLLYVHGNYLDSELAEDEQKLRLFTKLLEGSRELELAAAERVADALTGATGLPAVRASGGFGLKVGRHPAVFARNLAANRLINGAVVYLEPYYMNNRTVYQRIQLGDYDGLRDIDGRPCKSIYREYADAVAEGLRPLLDGTGRAAAR